MTRLPHAHAVLTFAAVLLAGCLPSSCQREESRTLFPSDSLSRARAETIPADTLQEEWSTAGTEAHPLEYPRTVRFGSDETIYVSDVQRSSLFVFSEEGTLMDEWRDDAFDVPYLAGGVGDTMVVFNPSRMSFAYVHAGAVVDSVKVDAAVPKQALRYGGAAGDALYVKAVGEDFDGFVGRVDADGTVDQRLALPGPAWRRAGLLRAWGDTLLSLSGFRPVVDVVPLRGEPTVDTLALTGFDSPMLARSRSFMVGDVREAPLLTPAAAPAGDLLFVINLRAGWLRIDAFDRAGMLRYRFSQAQPGYNKQFFPQDLDVRAGSDGEYDIVVVFSAPEPRVTRYRVRSARTAEVSSAQ